MPTLLSPGVNVSVIDESISTGAGEGTVPLILIATAQDKSTPDGTTTAVGTTQANANSIYLMTSQRELLQTFGDPIFQEVGGNSINGSPINEYGLLAAHSYLGVANRAYVIRADIDLSELEASVIEPDSPAAVGTVWFDTAQTQFGLFTVTDATIPTWEQVNIDFVFEGDINTATAPEISGAVVGSHAVVIDVDGAGDKQVEYYKVETTPGVWVRLDLTASDFQVNGVFPTTNSAAGALVLGDYWLKSSSGAGGANFVISVLSADTGNYVQQTAPLLVDDAAATTFYGANLATGDFYVDYDPVAATLLIKRWDGSAWVVNSTYEASATEPRQGPADGAYWYNPELGVDGDGLSSVDLLIKGAGNSWDNISLPGFATIPGQPTLYLQATDPVQQGAPLVDGDLWIDSDQVEEYPVISRWRASTARWILIDNSDQTTNQGIIFADARPDPEFGTDQGSNNGGGIGDPDLDIDAPDADAYPEGFLLWNTRYSSRNVKVWEANRLVDEDTFGNDVFAGRWVNASGNNVDGSPLMGTDAQRAVVVQAMQSVLVSNDDIRSEFLFFNLIANPGFPETIDEMVALNVDRKETAFIIADTPFDLPADSTSLQAWSSNANNAAGNGQDGLVTTDPNLGVYYPSGLATNLDGRDVVVPASHMMLRTYAFNDQVAAPWFAPAGLNRGRIDNASAVGYVDSEGEFVPVTLNQGQRDALYVNDVNSIAFIPNSGLVAYGQKTRNPFDSALSRVNVARLINYIRFQAEELARPLLFEPNDSQTRDNAKDAFDRFLAELVTRRGVTDFLVVCDESNNTPARIDRNELWIDIAVVPTKAVEFIYIPIRIRNTGSDLSANIGQA